MGQDSGASPLLIILSGLSGVGKDAVLDGLRGRGYPFHRVVTVTTRTKRLGERDSQDYRFVSEERFEGMVGAGELLEWAKVYGNWYGVPKDEIRRALSSGVDVMVKVDVQGARTIKGILPQAVFIFLTLSSLGEMEERLRGRSTESDADLRLRMETAREELESLDIFDYLVVNPQGEIEKAIAQIEAIIIAEKCRVKPRRVDL